MDSLDAEIRRVVEKYLGQSEKICRCIVAAISVYNIARTRAQLSYVFFYYDGAPEAATSLRCGTVPGGSLRCTGRAQGGSLAWLGLCGSAAAQAPYAVSRLLPRVEQAIEALVRANKPSTCGL